MTLIGKEKRAATIYLIGGFGNNLFQICLGEHLKNNGYNISYCDYFRRKNIFTRKMGWSVHEDPFLDVILDGEISSRRPNYLEVFQIFVIFLLSRSGLFSLRNFKWRDRKLKLFKRILIGYWQEGEHLNEVTFSAVKSKLEYFFSQSTKENETAFSESEIVVHYRGGDFPPEWRLSEDYYRLALGCLDLKPVIITNDMDASKNLFPDYSRIIKGDVAQDFRRLYYAKNLVMSNSTFCYWAAALGQSTRIVLPSKLNLSRDFSFPFFGPKEITKIAVEYSS